MAEHAALGPLELYMELIGPRLETGAMALSICLALEATDPNFGRDVTGSLFPGESSVQKLPGYPFAICSSDARQVVIQDAFGYLPGRRRAMIPSAMVLKSSASFAEGAKAGVFSKSCSSRKGNAPMRVQAIS